MKTQNVFFYVAMGIALIFATACTKEDLDKALDETLENALGTNMEYITGEWEGDYKLKRNDEQVKVQEGTVTVRTSDMAKDELLFDMRDMPNLRFKIEGNKLGIVTFTADMSSHFLAGSACYMRQWRSLQVSLKISETEKLEFYAKREDK